MLAVCFVLKPVISFQIRSRHLTLLFLSFYQVALPFYIARRLIMLLRMTVVKINLGASLVAQWLRIRLPMQGTWVQALVREDPTCRGATKPVHHKYWACALEPASHNYWSPCAWSPCSTTRQATTMRSVCTATKSSPCSLQLEKARAQQRRPSTAKNK